MASLIEFVLGNFTLTFLVLGVIAALIAVALKPGGFTFANVAEELLAYFILFSVAISFFYRFRLSRLLRRARRELHRLGRQPVPSRGRLREPRLCGNRSPRLQGQLLRPLRRDPRARDVPVGRRRRAYP